MPSLSSVFLLPSTLLALLVLQAAAKNPTAIKKLSLDSNEKILPEHLAFATFDFNPNATTRFYSRAYLPHYYETEQNMLRRAAVALAILERRSTCPWGMNSCAEMGSPNKCCQEGTYCTDVPDTDVGHVACCPEGSACGGGVGQCPWDAVSCPPALGGGCCISGYICQGIGCVAATATETQVYTSTGQSEDTITTTQTTIIEGEPSTVIVTLTVTRFPSVDPTTKTTTRIITATGTEETGGAPWRPTITEEPTTASEPTQTGCPTGFYGCLATHGGGCCQTDRNCEIHSCPAPPSTTIISNGVTVVVPAHNVPTTKATSCAEGWFVCGNEGGPVAGCCPSGYECGTASCFSAEATSTGRVQKQRPGSNAGVGGKTILGVTFGLVGLSLALLVL